MIGLLLQNDHGFKYVFFCGSGILIQGNQKTFNLASIQKIMRANMETISWFSAGVSSAVATKLAIKNIDRIIYIHIDDQHPDTMRFVLDCQEWFGKEIELWQHPTLKTVEDACLQYGSGYINGPYGATCSRELKRRLRLKWEKKHEHKHLCYVWGFDIEEKHRRNNIENSIPLFEHKFPLIKKDLSKIMVHKILNASGIKRPAMYDLGYPNNNCIGCVRGGQGYWCKIKEDFPEVFKQRAEMERKVGASCIKDKNGKIFLDELKTESGRKLEPIVEECGLFCELMAIK
jgi:hypothetical protein